MSKMNKKRAGISNYFERSARNEKIIHPPPVIHLHLFKQAGVKGVAKQIITERNLKTKSYKRLIIAHYITALIVIILVTSSSCAFRRVTRNKDIPYMEYDSARSIPAQQLNIFSPR